MANKQPIKPLIKSQVKSQIKPLIFDTGPIITLVLCRLEWILAPLRKKYGSSFLITPAVQRELIEHPLLTKRFKFEALQALKLIRDGILEVSPAVPATKVTELENLANSSFALEGKLLDVVQSGEVEVVAMALHTKANAVVIDERTLRLLMENPKEMGHLLERRFQKKVTVFPQKLQRFSSSLQGIQVIRSIELVALAYRLGLLDSYLPQQKDAHEVLLDSVLWAAKINGAAVTEGEIEEMKKILLKR